MCEIHGMISASEKMTIYSEKKTNQPSAAALGFKFIVLKRYCRLHGRFRCAVYFNRSAM